MKTECNSETGITIGLIDSLITVAHVIVGRNLVDPEIQEAIADLRATEDMKMLMNMGELSSAIEYIEQQKKELRASTSALELSNFLLKQQK